VRQNLALSHRPQGAPNSGINDHRSGAGAYRTAPESFTVGRDGRYVGEDGFVVPKDFSEFFERIRSEYAGG